MDALTALSRTIKNITNNNQNKNATLVGISGIDASGKGYLSRLLADELTRQALRVALINVDHWVEPPSRRFSRIEPARHFYQRGLRLDAMWQDVVLPLRSTRSVHQCLDACDATNQERYILLRMDFDEIDVILLEGIFLFKRQYQDRFDLRVWIECSFETGMERAVSRNAEGATEQEIRRDYETIYYPAQRLHFELDHPQTAADVTIHNDDFAGRAKL